MTSPRGSVAELDAMSNATIIEVGRSVCSAEHTQRISEGYLSIGNADKSNGLAGNYINPAIASWSLNLKGIARKEKYGTAGK